MDRRKHLRIALDGVERGIDGGKKLFAKPFGLQFVVLETSSEIQPADGKQPAETSASPGFGEHLVSGNNVVGITLVFGQTFVDYCAVGSA